VKFTDADTPGRKLERFRTVTGRRSAYAVQQIDADNDAPEGIS